MSRMIHKMVRWLAPVALFVLTAGPALAQSSAGRAQEVNPWPTIAVAALLSGLILGVSFKGSKRSHQD